MYGIRPWEMQRVSLQAYLRMMADVRDVQAAEQRDAQMGVM